MFLSIALLFCLLASIVIFSYFYWNRILIVFGIKKKTTTEDPEAPAQAASKRRASKDVFVETGQWRAQASMSSGSFRDSGSSAEIVGARLSNEPRSSSAGAATPMIVVAADSANRGNLIPYDMLAAACENWADSRRIGSGGAATVYRADLPRYGSVAVKRFHPDKQGGVREWTRELEALSQCRHPHILEIIGNADEGPENLIVMPLMQGGTLCDAMHKIQWATRVVNVGQVVRALSFLHGRRILHRDVKSSNILLDASLRHARLADFGLAKDQAAQAGLKMHHGTTGVVVGSPGYMAPELMMRPATEKTDAYATGVVCLEILTGLPAWDVDENGAVLTDRAIHDGSLVESLLDPKAAWPLGEVAACSQQAVGLTLFDPSQRKTLAAMEQDPSYMQHFERAVAAETARTGGQPSPGTLGSLS